MSEIRIGGLSAGTKAVLGIGFSTIIDEHIFTFLLSSPLTARTLAHAENQIKEVQKDLLIAVALSISFDLFIAFLLKSALTALWGIALSLLFAYLYVSRGNLWGGDRWGALPSM